MAGICHIFINMPAVLHAWGRADAIYRFDMPVLLHAWGMQA